MRSIRLGTFLAGLCLSVQCWTLAAAQQWQDLSWTSPRQNILALNTPHPIAATASSGLPVMIRVLAGPAVIENGMITISAPGTVHVLAEQPGNAEFLPALSSNFTLNARTYVLETVGVDATAAGTFIAASGVQVVRNRAYLLDGRNMVVIDVSEPATPRRLGVYRAQGTLSGIRVVGPYAYLANWDVSGGERSGLEIVNVEDANNLTRVGSNDYWQQASAVEVAGNYAYLGDRISGLRILDVSNPAAPVAVGSFHAGDAVRSVQVAGGIAYLAANDKGLQIVDVTNPAQPIRLGSLETLRKLSGVKVVGNRAYAVSFFDSVSYFYLVDVSNPREPKVLHSNYDNGGFDVDIQNGYAFVARPFWGLMVLDISHPTQSARLYSQEAIRPPLGEILGLQVVGDYIYTAFRESSSDKPLVGLKILKARFGYPNNLNFHPDSTVVVTNDFIPLPERSSNGALVNYSVVSGPGQIAGTNLVFTGIGEIVLRADQPDDGLYWPVQAERRIRTVKAPQAITWTGTPESILALNEPYPLNAIANSGLPVVVRVESGPARISSGTLIVTNLGALRVRAEVAGDETFLPAQEERVFNVPAFDITPLGSYFVSGYQFVGVHLKDNYAFVRYGVDPFYPGASGVLILDVSDPAKLVRVGEIESKGWAIDIAGNYAYVADHSAGIDVVDLSDLAKPSEIGRIDTPGLVTGIRAAGQYVYAAYSVFGGSGLLVIDARNPAAPKVAGRLFSNQVPASRVDVSGNLVYMTRGQPEPGLQIIDVSDPAAPKSLSSLQTQGGDPGDVQVVGNLAYVADYYGGLHVIDVTDPARPWRVDSHSFNTQTSRLDVEGNYAWLAQGTRGLMAVDVSDPARPLLAGSFQTARQAAGHSRGYIEVKVAGQLIYAAEYDDGFKIFSWDDSRHPQRISWSAPGDELSLGAPYALAAESTSGLPVSYRVDAGPAVIENGQLRLTGPGTVWVSAEQSGNGTYSPAAAARPFNVRHARITPVSRYLPEAPAWGVQSLDMAGNLLYFVESGEGLTILDASDPQNLRRAGSYQRASAQGVRVAGNHAFVLTQEGLLVLDVGDPAQPKEIASLLTDGRVYGLELAGNYAFFTKEFEGLTIVDVRDPAKPLLVQTLADMGLYGAAVAGNLAYLDGPSGLHIIEVSDPATPKARGVFEMQEVRGRVAVGGSYAFASDNIAGKVFIIDARNPDQPTKAGEISIGQTAAMTKENEYLYLVNNYSINEYARAGGLHVFDLTDPHRPLRVGSFNSDGGKGDLLVKDGFVYVAGDGLEVYRIELSSQLQLRMAPGKFPPELSWNSALEGVKLQKTASIGPAANWQDVPGTPEELNGESRVPIDHAGGNAFYRLMQRR